MSWRKRASLAGLVVVALLPSGAAAQAVASDPARDGAIIGAVVGAGAGLGLVGVAFASCTGSCEAPEPAGMYSIGAAYGAGIGAFTGWLIDRLHKGKETVLAVLSPVLTNRHRGIALSVEFLSCDCDPGT
jgi:ABC-type Fe3+-siderophore transport system permease subunit